MIPLWHLGHERHQLLARLCARGCTCGCNVEFNPVSDSRFPVRSEVSGLVSQSKIKFCSHDMILIKARQRTLALESTHKTGQGGRAWASRGINRATHKILQSGARGGQLTTVTPPAKSSGSYQWRFVG